MNQTKSTSKKLLALLLALIMTVSLLPMSVFAAELGTEPAQEEEAVIDVPADGEDGEDVEDVEPADGEGDVTLPEEPAEDAEPEEEPVDTYAAENGIAVQAAMDTQVQYKILHLDCGRKYFTKDWIIALLNEMSAADYNQLQLAFGNDGLRFLLDDMSFTANGKTYSHDDVVAKVEAGNIEQNTSGDKRWLTQTEMDAIIEVATSLDIQIVPLLNLPGHANAILDIVDDTYNANIYGTKSQNTLDVTNAAACDFAYALFVKYVDYFAGKGCKFFNFGADEYGNDVGGNPHFDVLQGKESQNLFAFMNRLAAYILQKGMTPRTFNDALYYGNANGGWDMQITTNEAIKEIQCCYWSAGWSTYPVASPTVISQKGHDMINTHGDFYYILGKSDKFDESGYNYAAQFNNTSFVGGTISNPVGSMFCIWCDYPNAETETEVAQKVRLPLRAMALRMDNQSINGMSTAVVANGFNADGTLNNSTGGESGGDTDPTTKEENITLTVGKTSKEYTQDGDVTGNVNTDGYDRTVASYTAEYKQDDGKLVEKAAESLVLGTAYYIKGTDGKYLDSSAGWVDSIDKAAKWTWTTNYDGDGCFKNDNGKYLYWSTYNETLSAATYSWNGTAWTLENGVLTCEYFSYNSYEYVTKTLGTPVTQETTDPAYKTVITFTGKKVGNTTVTIGNVKYNIAVTAEDLTNVTPLTVEYWITNSRISDSENTSVKEISINAADAGIATQAGVDIAKLVAPKGIKDGRNQEYWQSKILDVEKTNTSTSGTELQTEKEGDDETLNGQAFTKVRYFGGKWQVYTTTWIDVDRTQVTVKYTQGSNNTNMTYTGDKNQLVAYYMEVVDIKNDNGTTNLHVNAADWGTKGNGGNFGYNASRDAKCSVSIQLVYEDGSLNPAGTTANDLKSKTIVYGYWAGGRGLGTMIFNGQENYQIYKVTAETGTMTSTFNTNGNTVTVTNLTWQNNEETVWEGAPTASVSIGNPSRNPSYEEPYDNLAWNTDEYNKNNAILIRVYVKSIAKADALHVNYFEEGKNDPFYDYGINVDANTKFDPNFGLTDTNTLTGNTVTDYEGVLRTVQSDLSKMPKIGAQYRYSDYELVGATLSDDGKTANLYYRFTRVKTFVVDFGLPLKITPGDVNTNLAASGVKITGVDVTTNSSYANITTDVKSNITYTLNKMISDNDTFGIQYKGTLKVEGTDEPQTGETAQYTITIIPASTVYYEDSFASFYDAGSTEAKKMFEAPGESDEMGTWYVDGTEKNVTQALEALGSKQNVYGYDPAYDNCTTFSMGSAKKVTVDASTYETHNANPTAQFTFKGTGFDVISLTDNTSGAIFVDVVHKNGAVEKKVVVDNYYGYTRDANGEWVVDNESNNCLYQIPVIKVNGLPYDEYTVTIKVAYNEYFDHTTKEAYSFWLDAIRVYDPMGKDYKDYTKDGEGYPQYIKLRDELANGDVTAEKNAVFIDGAANATIEQYKNYGPNNEVYLASGQAITFKVPDNAKIATVQIGAKMPAGVGCKMSVNGTEVSIAGSATEMYYALSVKSGDSVIITNTGSGILSLTNLKLTFTEKQNTVTLATLSAEDTSNAVAAVRALFAAPVEPDPEPVVFVPERFEASWSRSTVKVGQKATLTVKTSEDVEAITVDGVTIDTYRTRTQRTGWGWNAKRVTYREFTYTITAKEAGTLNCSVAALNAENVASEPITAALTVQAAAQRPSWGGWLGNLFGRWF